MGSVWAPGDFPVSFLTFLPQNFGRFPTVLLPPSSHQQEIAATDSFPTATVIPFPSGMEPSDSRQHSQQQRLLWMGNSRGRLSWCQTFPLSFAWAVKSPSPLPTLLSSQRPPPRHLEAVTAPGCPLSLWPGPRRTQSMGWDGEADFSTGHSLLRLRQT